LMANGPEKVRRLRPKSLLLVCGPVRLTVCGSAAARLRAAIEAESVPDVGS
jgi:hypothetical protein